MSLILAGAAVGVVCSLAIGRLNEPEATAAGKPQESAPAAAPIAPAGQDTGATDPEVTATGDPGRPVEPAGVPAAAGASGAVAAPPPSTTGVIVLPARADGRRVYVDGRVVEVKDRRAEVPCGRHEVQIGSQGRPRELDLACGAETEVP